MKRTFSAVKFFIIALFFIGLLAACGSGKGCDCPSFGSTQNMSENI